MKKQIARIMLASEYPEVRHWLEGLVKKQAKSVVVGEAGNGIKAMTLARSLRPDVVIMDSRLPYLEGFDGVSLSRMGGLDAAQAISQETNGTGVILLGNLDTGVMTEPDLGSNPEVYIAKDRAGTMAPHSLQEVSDLAVQMREVIFANVQTKQSMTLRQKVAANALGANLSRVLEYSDRASLIGGFALIGGLCLIATMILAPIGAVLVAVGGAMLLIGKTVRTTAALRLRRVRARQDRRAEEAPEKPDQPLSRMKS